MTAVLVVLAVVLALLVLGWIVYAARRSEERTLTFADPITRAQVALRAGAVSFVAVEGTVRVHRAIRWALAKPVMSERIEGGTLRIDAGSPRAWQFGGQISYRIEVPAHVDVEAATGAGTVGVEGTSGAVDLRTRAGRIALANVSGPVRASTQAGEVHGTDIRSTELEVASNAGSVSLTFDVPPDRVDARTNAGSVELAVPDGPYAVSATVDEGQVYVDVANDPAAARRLVVHSNAGVVRVRGR